ncbi:MAG: hypothetical protein EOO73_29900 [Myxococcales bacterium]|nr:MAG: hypothetical protein EOO73_29900 [Myxococcales bacterium]
MHADIELEKLGASVQKVLGEGAPLPAQLMAAKGIVPGAKPHEIVIALAVLSGREDEKVRAAAMATLGKLPPPILNGALSVDLPGSVIGLLASPYAGNHEVLEKLLRMPRITGGALELLAGAADERAGELIATNEELMLKHPTVIEKLYMNKQVRMSTADRLIELCVRNGIELSIPAFKEAALAIKNELIAEPSEEPTYDDVLFNDTQKAAEDLPLGEGEDTHEIDEEGEEKVKEKAKPLYAQLAEMTVSQRVRCATLGSAAMRLLCVRDSNRLVAAAAAKSPLLKEPEAVQISASRVVSEDVLRILAMNKEFVRNYQIKLNLVSNPRTPFTFSSRLVPMLRESELKMLSKSKNVSGAVSTAVRQQLAKKNARQG